MSNYMEKIEKPKSKIETILNSKDLLFKIITSDDRHDLSNFLYDVQRALNNGTLQPKWDTFRLFKNGYVLDCILGLKELEKEGRKIQQGEILDKINYLSLLPDIQSLTNIYTDSRIIASVVDNTSQEYQKYGENIAFWFDCGTGWNLPFETKRQIAKKLSEVGAENKAIYIIDSFMCMSDIGKFKDLSVSEQEYYISKMSEGGNKNDFIANLNAAVPNIENSRIVMDEQIEEFVNPINELKQQINELNDRHKNTHGEKAVDIEKQIFQKEHMIREIEKEQAKEPEKTALESMLGNIDTIIEEGRSR